MTLEPKKPSRSPLFENMTLDEREQTLLMMERSTFTKDEYILKEGKSTQALRMIVQGECEVFKTGQNNEHLTLAKIGTGSVFGEMSFFHPAPHSASVKAIKNADILSLTKENYDLLLEKCPESAYKIAFGMAHVMADRLRAMDDWTENLVNKGNGEGKNEEWQDFRAKLYSFWQY